MVSYCALTGLRKKTSGPQGVAAPFGLRFALGFIIEALWAEKRQKMQKKQQQWYYQNGNKWLIACL